MIEIRLLLPGDDRAGFSSGDPRLDEYFRSFAGQNQFRHRIGANYVALESGRICGYVTVCPAQIETRHLTPALARRLPDYPVPVLRLARLAVARSHQRRGIGQALLRYALMLAHRMSRDYGCAGVVVDAKPEAVPYYQRFGFHTVAAEGGQLPHAPIPMFLALKSIPRPRELR